MNKDNSVKETRITALYLSTLNKEQLIALLQYKTELLLAATTSRVIDPSLIKTVNGELEAIQAAILRL